MPVPATSVPTTPAPVRSRIFRGACVQNFLTTSLSRKILVVLIASVAAVMAGVILLTFAHQKRSLLREMNIINEETASVVFTGILYPMSLGHNQAVRDQLLVLRDLLPEAEVYVIDRGQRIVFSTHEDRISSRLERYITGTAVQDQISFALRTGTQPEHTFEDEKLGKRSFIHVHIVRNQPGCVKCHGALQEVLGGVVLRKSADKHYAAILDIRNNNILMSVLGICAIVGLAHVLMVRLVSRPVASLAAQIRMLPDAISSDKGPAAPPDARTDEIGELQNAFTAMATELHDKTHAIAEASAELAKANKELEAFAYSVSHDLRAPLRNIDGFSKILLEDYSAGLDEKAKHYLRRVRNGSMRMAALIDDMLAFSRIGRADLQFRALDCRAVIDRIVEFYAAEIGNRQVSLVVGDLPRIQCDPTLIQSLFSNLLANALKYTRDVARPEIEIGFDRTAGAIFVKDNGVGFDMQYHDKIFQVFQRLHLPEEYEGTGIGLAIVKRIAERHKGQVWAESKPGMGATFFIKLPLVKEAPHV